MTNIIKITSPLCIHSIHMNTLTSYFFTSKPLYISIGVAMQTQITNRPCFKYRPIRPRNRPISPLLPVGDTIWENCLSYRLQQKTADI